MLNFIQQLHQGLLQLINKASRIEYAGVAALAQYAAIATKTSGIVKANLARLRPGSNQNFVVLVRSFAIANGKGQALAAIQMEIMLHVAGNSSRAKAAEQQQRSSM